MIDRYKMLVFRGVKNSVFSKVSATETVRKLWQKPGQTYVVLAALLLQGCASGLPTFVPLDGPVTDRLTGYIVSDSPQAALIGSYALEAGGNAADAVVAVGFALAVSLPSRAGLGGGGACLYFNSATGYASVYEFLPRRPTIVGQPPRFSTAVPGTVRGLFALHVEFGRLPWSANLVRAETMARFGDQVSRSLAVDLAEKSGNLVNDRNALDRFMSNRRQFLQEGDGFRQVGLAGLLGRLRSGRAGSFYAGEIAQLTAEQAQLAGGALTVRDLNSYRVMVTHQLEVSAESGRYEVAIAAGPDEAVTAYTVLDVYGNAAACVMTMGQSFGAGLMVEDFGMLLSVPPEGTADHFLSVEVNDRVGVKTVQVTSDDAEPSLVSAIRCEDGFMAKPAACRMDIRTQSNGLAVQAGERE